MGAVSFMRPRLFLFGGAAVGAYRVPLIALRLMQLRRSTFGEARRPKWRRRKHHIALRDDKKAADVSRE
jgi:hypothetical protein